MSKQYANLHAMAKTSVKFQNDWQKTVGGVALTSQLLMNGQTDGSRHAYIAPALARRCDKNDNKHPKYLGRNSASKKEVCVLKAYFITFATMDTLWNYIKKTLSDKTS